MTKVKNYRIEEDGILIKVPERQLEMWGIEDFKIHNSVKRSDSAPSLNNGLNVVSLFTGAGGLDIGFKEAGFNCIFASDNRD